MRAVKLKRFLVEKISLFSRPFSRFFFFKVAANMMCDEWTQQEAVLKIIISLFNIDEDPWPNRKSRDFFFICRQKTTHMRISRISTLFFNNNNTYYIYTQTHTNAGSFSLPR